MACAEVTELWKYGSYFITIKAKCSPIFESTKKLHQPYIGFVDGNKIEHEDLLQEKKARMKILLINPLEDLPEEKIKLILNQGLSLPK